MLKSLIIVGTAERKIPKDSKILVYLLFNNFFNKLRIKINIMGKNKKEHRARVKRRNEQIKQIQNAQKKMFNELLQRKIEALREENNSSEENEKAGQEDKTEPTSNQE